MQLEMDPNAAYRARFSIAILVPLGKGGEVGQKHFIFESPTLLSPQE